MNFLFLDTVGYESALRLSGHHYARLLVRRGHRVLSLSAPVTPWHRLSRRNQEAIRKRMEAHRAGFTEAPGGVQHYVPHSWIPIRSRWPFDRDLALDLAAGFYRRDVLSRLEYLDFHPDVVSLQNLMFFPLVREFPDAVLHYRMTDKMDAFKDYPACLLKAEARVLEEADLISVTSRQFLPHLTTEQQSRALYAPNGVDLEHFSRPRPRPQAFENIDAPIAVYVGALRDWFDWDLLHRTMQLLPGVRFVLISPDAPPEGKGQGANFTWIPGVPYEDIPAYYQHAAATIIPFINSPLVAPVNPIKMFESLAAGTPVVAREWDELKKLEAPIRLVTDAKGMASAIEAAISTGASERASYEQFPTQFSWDANLDRLLERIDTVKSRKIAGRTKGGGV